MKELTGSEWVSGPLKQLMFLRMSREDFQKLVGCCFTEFEEDQGKEWATGFYIESIGQIAIIEYEVFPGMLEVSIKPGAEHAHAKELILREFGVSEALAEDP